MPDLDLVLYNGKVVTLDKSSHIFQAVGIANGRIVSVGDSEMVLRDMPPAAHRIDLAGRTVTPGFYDSHPHMDREGLKFRGGIPLDGIDSIEGILDIVRKAVATTPEGEWIVLMPMGTPPTNYVYKPDQLVDKRFPTRNDLDKVSPKHPVYIRAPWGWWSHRPFPSIANTLAIKTAGVTRDTVMPYNTQMLKDADGEPNGIFLDRNYAPVLEYTLFRALPRFSYEDRVAGVELGAKAYVAAGTTSCYEGHGITPSIIQAYREVNARGDLPLRMTAPLSMPTAAFNDRKIGDILYAWSDRLAGRGTSEGMFRMQGICVDVGDPHVAALIGQHYPYEQWAGHFYQSLTHERFVEIGVIAARLGLRLNCLVCYDLERVLRAYEAINQQVTIRDQRWVIIHVIEATPDQLRRIKELGLFATVTPNFMYMADDRFGLDKLRDKGIPIRQLLDMGIPMALSTDNVPYSMLFTMWQALTRWDNDSKSKLGESNLGREEALRLSVQTGHMLDWNEGNSGSIEAGKVADLTVLGDNPLTCDEDQIKDISVDATIVGGKIVHEARASKS
jgi:predicted amidohydrolase YtcJ